MQVLGQLSKRIYDAQRSQRPSEDMCSGVAAVWLKYWAVGSATGVCNWVTRALNATAQEYVTHGRGNGRAT